MKMNISFKLRTWIDRKQGQSKSVKAPLFVVMVEIPDIPLLTEVNAGIDKATKEADEFARQISKDYYCVLNDSSKPTRMKCGFCSKTFWRTEASCGCCSKKCRQAWTAQTFAECFN